MRRDSRGQRPSALSAWLFRKADCHCEAISLNSGNKSPQPPSLGLAQDPSASDPRTTAKPNTALLPQIATRYEVQSIIGKGGMGTVYKVRDSELNQIFAVRVLHPELAADKLAVKRFEQEAEAAATLSHANLVSVYAHGLTNDGTPYLVMDYIPGQTIAETLFQEGYIDVSRALNIFLQICEGLTHAHQEGIIHRDLKPGNIILSQNESMLDLTKNR